jgi:hypothetical protein
LHQIFIEGMATALASLLAFLLLGAAYARVADGLVGYDKLGINCIGSFVVSDEAECRDLCQNRSGPYHMKPTLICQAVYPGG